MQARCTSGGLRGRLELNSDATKVVFTHETGATFYDDGEVVASHPNWKNCRVRLNADATRVALWHGRRIGVLRWDDPQVPWELEFPVNIHGVFFTGAGELWVEAGKLFRFAP